MVEPSKKKGIISLDDIIQDEKNDGKHREFTNPNGTTATKTFDNSGDDQQQKPDCTITLWQGGFQIDEGEFRSDQDPQNKKFLEDVRNKTVPQELRQKYPNKDVNVALVQEHQNDPFPQPKQKFVAFSDPNGGLVLGGQKESLNVAIYPADIVLKEGDQVNIKLMLNNGKTEMIKINLSDKVQSLYNYACKLSGSNKFILKAGVPPAALTNLNQTIKDSKLANTKVIQE